MFITRDRAVAAPSVVLEEQTRNSTMTLPPMRHAPRLAWWVQRPGGDHDFPNQENTMRTTQLLTTAVLLALGACAPAVSVRTALTRDVSLRGLATFAVVPGPNVKIEGAGSSAHCLDL